MKNAMKKLMSLLLVAVLLVSAVPFAASAAGQVHIITKLDGAVVEDFNAEIKGDSAPVSDLITYKLSGTPGTFCHAYVSGKGVGDAGLVVANGETVEMAFFTDPATCPKHGTPANPNPDPNPNPNPDPDPTPDPEPVVEAIKVVVKVDTSDNVVFTGSKVPANGSYSITGDLLTYVWSSDWDNKYTFDHAWTQRTGSFNDKNVQIKAGEEVHIMLKSVKINTNTNTNNNNSNNGIADEFGLNDIYLYIYINNDITQPAKRVLLNNYNIVSDHTLSKAEIMSVVDDYYKASNANNGIVWKGAYVGTNDTDILKWIGAADETANGTMNIEGLREARRNSPTVVVKVRVTGVTTVGTTYTADSSNPKTGDSIYTAFAVMGISAASLAAVMYVYNKKRMAL